VLALDARTDLALLAVEKTGEHVGEPIEMADGATGAEAVVVTGDGETPVTIVRRGRLVVHDATDRASYERQVLTFTPGVDGGTSGAPLVDGDRRLLGIVVLDGDGVAYAVTADEVTALLERAPSGRGSTACESRSG
jgi:hypothetical protein